MRSNARLPCVSSVPSLWCYNNVSQVDANRAPGVLADVLNDYHAVLGEAGIQDLAYMFGSFKPSVPDVHLTTFFSASNHSYPSNHTLVRGFDTSGWPAFAVHIHSDDPPDEAWLYSVNLQLRRRRNAKHKSYKHLTLVSYPFKSLASNFVRDDFHSVGPSP
jgi:hypothetical protein